MFAVLSDIHSNLEALQEVLADIKRQSIRKIICLGDIIGYGADPVACLKLISKSCEQCVLGNHDLAVFGQVLGFNPIAQRSLTWTRTQLKPGFFSRGERKQIWQYLKSNPQRHEEGKFLFVHGSPRDPISEYLTEADTLDLGDGGSDKLKINMNLVKHTCFIGHTHRPGIIDSYRRFFTPAECGDQWQLSSGPTLINVGSVGQPRDNDPRSSYITVNESSIKFHRVPYDVKMTCRKIRNISDLDPSLAERLLTGT